MLPFAGKAPMLNRLTRSGRIGPCPLSPVSSLPFPEQLHAPATLNLSSPNSTLLLSFPGNVPLPCGHLCPVYPSDLSSCKHHVFILELVCPVTCSSLSRLSRPWPSPAVSCTTAWVSLCWRLAQGICCHCLLTCLTSPFFCGACPEDI